MNLNKSLSIIAFCIGTLVIVGITLEMKSIIVAIKALESTLLQVFCTLGALSAYSGYIAVIYFLIKGGKNVEK
jgi:hypothetical protein